MFLLQDMSLKLNKSEFSHTELLTTTIENHTEVTTMRKRILAQLVRNTIPSLSSMNTQSSKDKLSPKLDMFMKLYKNHNRELSHQLLGNRLLPKSLQFIRQDPRLTSRPLKLIQHMRSIESKEKSENKLSIKRFRMSTSNAVRLLE